jgi:hypothetical protein
LPRPHLRRRASTHVAGHCEAASCATSPPSSARPRAPTPSHYCRPGRVLRHLHTISARAASSPHLFPKNPAAMAGELASQLCRPVSVQVSSISWTHVALASNPGRIGAVRYSCATGRPEGYPVRLSAPVRLEVGASPPP